MNRPTPDPSEEGSRHWCASCQFPSWEGLGGFMVPMHSKKRKGALHEPYDALLANEQVIHPGFMVPMHSKKRKGALHEPYDGLLANEQVIHPECMVPMHSKKRKTAFHEPHPNQPTTDTSE